MRLKGKINLLFFLVGLLPLLIGSILSVGISKKTIEDLVTKQLNAIDCIKKEQIESFFDERYSDIKVLAEAEDVIEGMEGFHEAYEQGLHSAAYQEVAKIHEAYFKDYIEAYGYHDLFLVDLQGEVVFTAAKEEDLGINLNEEKNQNLALAKAFRAGKESTALMDYEYYEISGHQASFIATPIYNESKMPLGVLILQISDESIQNIMRNVEGLGKTGEAYLVGEDLYMRSNSRFSEEKTIGKQQVDTLSVKKALNGEEGTHIIKDYRGHQVVSAYEPLEIQGLKWVIITEINKREAFAGTRSLVMVISSMVIILVAILGAAGYFFSKKLTDPIIELKTVANQVADYDLTAQIGAGALGRSDEVGELARAVEKIISNLKEIILAITNGNRQVTVSSQELTAMLEEATASSEEVSRAVVEIANGAMQQAKGTDEGKQQAVQLGEYIEQDGKHVKELNVATQAIGTAVNEGLEVMKALIQTSDESDRQVQFIQKDILQTDESARKIEEVSKVIASIADQTNLLALNASIEAARAGEAGKGFTVVAEEIRKLAEQSSHSIETINAIVLELQDNSKRTVERIKVVVDTLEEERKNIQSSRSQYEAIEKEMHVSENVVGTLNDSARNMEHAKNDILEVLAHLAVVAEENSASTEEVTASIEQQNVGINEMTKTSLALSQLATELQDVINKFKID